jgi:hypothetical protein
VNWVDFMRQALTMLDFGHSVFEKVYEMTEYKGKPRIGLAKLAPRKQTTIYYWETPDHQPGITQWLLTRTGAGETGAIGIPREKLMYFINEREGDNFNGTSLLRYCYKDWHMKSKLTLVNAVGLEKQAVGVPKVTGQRRPDPERHRRSRRRSSGPEHAGQRKGIPETAGQHGRRNAGHESQRHQRRTANPAASTSGAFMNRYSPPSWTWAEAADPAPSH